MFIPTEVQGLQNVKTLEEFLKRFRGLWKDLALIINGRISFAGGITDNNNQANMDGVWISFVSTGANQVLTHQLNRMPVGFILINKSGTCDIWQGAAYTTTQITVNTTVAGIDFLIFVI